MTSFFLPLEKSLLTVLSGCAMAIIGGETFLFYDRIHKIPISQSAGFAVAGVALLLCACMTLYYALKRQFKFHREWAIRTFAIGIGSWILRVWMFLIARIAGTYVVLESNALNGFLGWWFWVSNLAAAEMYIRMSANKTVDWASPKYYYPIVISTGGVIVVSLGLWLVQMV